MCHSPSGAFWVQTPDRACWASADITTAADKPAASPPDTTFCAKRFITNLREKGDSPALRQLTRCCGTDIERKDWWAVVLFAVCRQRQFGTGCAQPTPARGNSGLDDGTRPNGNMPISCLSDFAEPHCL